MRFGHPDWWWLWLVPVVGLAAYVYGHLLRRHLMEKAGHLPLVQKLISTFSLERRLFKQLLVFLGLCLLTFAAMRPQFGRRPEPLRRTGVDIAIAFDISKSMLARDVQPSRLAAARSQLLSLLERMKGDRVALVPFAGIAFTQSPLTADQSAIRLYLESLDPRNMPVGGTNIGMALEEATRLLTSTTDRGDKSSRSRVIVVITDGEDVATDKGEAAKAAARKAAEQGIYVYGVAVGTRSGEPVPILNEDGSHAGYQKDRKGKIIYSKLNAEFLEELTRLADPSAADAVRVFQYDGGEPVSEVIAGELDSLQKTTLESSIRHTHGEKFQYALFPAIFLLLFDLLLGERRRRK